MGKHDEVIEVEPVSVTDEILPQPEQTQTEWFVVSTIKTIDDKDAAAVIAAHPLIAQRLSELIAAVGNDEDPSAELEEAYQAYLNVPREIVEAEQVPDVE